MRSMDIFGFSQWFFCDQKVNLGTVLYLAKKKNMCMLHTRGVWVVLALFRRRVGCFQESKNTFFFMSLRAPPCPFLVGVVCVFGYSLVCYKQAFFSFSFASLENYSLALLVVDISTSISILLISHFLSLSFYRNFIYFQFYY